MAPQTLAPRRNFSASETTLDTTFQRLTLRPKLPASEGQAPFSLMKLPKDLRFMVYEEYFQLHDKPNKSSPKDVRHNMPFLQSNRLIRHEAGRLFYRDNFKRYDDKERDRANPPILTTSDFILVRKIPIFFRCTEPDFAQRMGALVSQIITHGNAEQEISICFRPDTLKRPTSLQLITQLLAMIVPLTQEGTDVSDIAVWKNFLRRRADYQSWSLDLTLESFRIEHFYDSDPHTGETEYEIFCVSGPLVKLDWERLLWQLESRIC